MKICQPLSTSEFIFFTRELYIFLECSIYNHLRAFIQHVVRRTHWQPKTCQCQQTLQRDHQHEVNFHEYKQLQIKINSPWLLDL